MSIKVLVSPQMKALAQYAEDSLTEFVANKPNYTGLEREHKYYYGTLGELAFIRLLAGYKKRALFRPRYDTKSDSYDTLVKIQDQNQKIDVKTATQVTHTRIMQPHAQHQKANIDYYVGVRINSPDEVEIFGVCEPGNMKLAETGFTDGGIPTMWTYLEELVPINIFMSWLDDGETKLDLTPEMHAVMNKVRQKQTA